jgi:hypothetical protein
MANFFLNALNPKVTQNLFSKGMDTLPIGMDLAARLSMADAVMDKTGNFVPAKAMRLKVRGA